MARKRRRGFYLGTTLVWLVLQVFVPAIDVRAEARDIEEYESPGGPSVGQPGDVSGAEEEQAVARGSRTGQTPKRPDPGPEVVPPPPSAGIPNPARTPQSQARTGARKTGTSSPRDQTSVPSRTGETPAPSHPAYQGHPRPVGARYVDDVVCGPAEQSCRTPVRTASGPAHPLLAGIAHWIADPTLYGIVTLAGILMIGALCTLEPRLRRRRIPQRMKLR